MFARVGRSAFVCRRCQLRLARQAPEALLPQRQHQLVTPARRRWQSAAALQLEDEEEEAVDWSPPASNVEERPPDPPSPADVPQTERRRHTKTRSFKPSESLGVARLGEPADVLILPSRDRKIPEVPEDEGTEPKAKLHDLLNPTKEPLTQEQLKSNIEHIKQQAKKDGGELDRDTWKRMRGGLAKGFTRRQLFAYSQLTKPTATTAQSHKRLPSQTLAEHILTKLWGFRVDSQQHSIPKQASQASQRDQREHSTKFEISEQALEACLTDARRPFDKIAEKFHVKIDVFRETHELLLTGANVGAPSRQIRTLCRRIKATTFRLNTKIQALFEGPLGSLFLEKMRHKYGLLINFDTETSCLNVAYLEHSAAKLELLRRELFLHSEPRCSYLNVFSYPRLRAARKIPVLPHTIDTLSETDSRFEWGRLVWKDPSQAPELLPKHLTNVQKINVEVTTRELLTSLAEKPSTWPHPDVKTEVFASFGQVLRDIQQPDRHTSATSRSYGSRSMFVNDLPLVPQMLARCKPWPTNHADEVDTLAQQSFVGSCVLEPMSENPHAPTIEIILTGRDIAGGFDQPLQVKRVCLRSDERSQALSLPGEVSDVLFTRRQSLDVFTSAHLREQFRFLLQQIGAFLGQAKSSRTGSPSPAFPPFCQLTIPTQAYAVAQQDTQPAADTDKEQETLAPRSECMYILKSADTLDVATYRSPYDINTPLEHIVRNGGDWAPDRQELILGTSMWNAEPQDWLSEKKFRNLLMGALHMAVRIGDKKLLGKGLRTDSEAET